MAQCQEKGQLPDSIVYYDGIATASGTGVLELLWWSNSRVVEVLGMHIGHVGTLGWTTSLAWWQVISFIWCRAICWSLSKVLMISSLVRWSFCLRHSYNKPVSEAITRKPSYARWSIAAWSLSKLLSTVPACGCTSSSGSTGSNHQQAPDVYHAKHASYGRTSLATGWAEWEEPSIKFISWLLPWTKLSMFIEESASIVSSIVGSTLPNEESGGSSSAVPATSSLESVSTWFSWLMGSGSGLL